MTPATWAHTVPIAEIAPPSNWRSLAIKYAVRSIARKWQLSGELIPDGPFPVNQKRARRNYLRHRCTNYDLLVQQANRMFGADATIARDVLKSRCDECFSTVAA